MICGSFVNLSIFKDIRIISQNPYTTISIAPDPANPTNRYIFKTFNFNCTTGHHQKIFADVFSDISILTLSSSSIPANNYAISQNSSIFSFFNATHYYESYSSLDFSNRLKPTFCSLCISEITLDKILRRQVQISNTWTLEDSLNCLFSVAISMKRLHDNLLIHGNLCPSNIIVDKVKQCYISDFGLYKIKELYYKPPFTNPQYSAPEIDPLNPSKATDVFSYGVIMCRLLQEYYVQNNFNLISLILEGRYDFKPFPPFLADIISKSLLKNPSKRCSFGYIIQTFQEKSFVIKRINVSDYFNKFKHMFYIENLANANDPVSLNILGDLLSNPNKAFEIRDRNPESIQHLKKKASDRSHGSYVKYDPSKQIDEQMSAECYKRSALLGNSEAQANYGVCLLSGNGIPIDMLNGISNIENSAKQGCVKGLYIYGICNMKGIGVNKIDLITAEKYLRAAAESSDKNVNNINNTIICKARYNLGLIMEKQNKEFEAAKCFKLAAYLAIESKTNLPNSFACPEALYAYGCYLKNGIGVSTDLTAACYFFKMSHFQGYKPGSFEYAKMVLDDEISSNIGTSPEDFEKYEKKEAKLIMKSLSESNYSKAGEYLQRKKLTQNIIKESSSKDKSKEKSKDSEKERNKEKERSRDKDRIKDIEKDKNKEKERSRDKDRIKDREIDRNKEIESSKNLIESSKSKQKKTLSNEKLKEKFIKLQKELVEKKSTHLFDYEKDFIELKNADIIYKLAVYYHEGEYVKQDIDKACYYYKLSADLGNSDAQAAYGNLLYEGKVGPDYKKDLDGAMKMFQKSAMQGNSEGLNKFSLYLIDEKNTDPKVIRYVHALKDMADKGPNLAKLFYGKLLLKGPKYDHDRDKEGFHKNPEEGIRYIRMAVDAKVPRANYTYALCMLKGNGMPKNEKKAIQAIEDIANKENDLTPILKCYRYYRDSDPKKALTFLKKAADLGSKDHMYKYGEKLMYGDFSEAEVKEGESYMIKSGKEIPRDVQFKYFKKVNGKYVEIQEEKNTDLDKFFSDDYEIIEQPKKDDQSKEDEAEIEDLEPEQEEEPAVVIQPDPISEKPLTSSELKNIDKKVIQSYLKDRKSKGLSKDTDEIAFVSDAINGDTEAMNYLGDVLMKNEQTIKYATQFYKFSCDRNNPTGMMRFADNILKGIGIRQNKKNAYSIYEKIADVYKIPEACFQFGDMNENKIGCQKSKYKAFKYYLQAADQGHEKAMLRVADCYSTGISGQLSKDNELMVKYLKMALQQNPNSITANSKLGEYYLEVEHDPKEAFGYLKEAAAYRNVRSYYLLYKLYSKFDYGPKLVSENDAQNYLQLAYKGNDKDAKIEYENLNKRQSKQENSEFVANSFIDVDDDNDDGDYEFTERPKKKNKKEIVQEFEEDFESDDFQNIDNDKDYIQQVIGIDPTQCDTQEIINIGDDILARANEIYTKKQIEIDKEFGSKAAALNASNIAREEYEAEKQKAERCYSYVMSKGEPIAYFKLGQITDDPEQALSYLEYAKNSGIPVEDFYKNTLDKIGNMYKNKYTISKKNNDKSEENECKEKMKFVAQKFKDQDDFVNAALWFKNAGDSRKFNHYIDVAKEKLDSLDGKQQFLLGQILEAKQQDQMVTESARNEQKKLVLEIYKRAIQNGYKEAESSYKNMSKKFLDEMGSNPDDSRAQNELGLSFLEGRNGAKIDYKKAVSYFEKAASNGNVDSIVNLAKCFLFGRGVQQDGHKAFQLFKKASMFSSKFVQIDSPSNNFFSQISTDIESSTTSSDDENESDTFLLFNKQTSSSHVIHIDNNKDHESLAEGICYYAYCLMKGFGSKEDDDDDDSSKIMKFFKLAAKMGNLEAMVQYGKNCIEQPDGPELLKIAAKSGNPEAQFYYSRYLEDKDESLSKKYLKQAAENKSYVQFFPPDKNDETDVNKAAGYFEPAVESWGKILYSNIYDEPDVAIQYFKKLSEDQNVYGLSMYAKLIYDGVVEDSEDEASGSETKYTKILKMAADLGDSESQYLYAINKMEDEEENNSSQEVSKYLKMAADQGNVKAACSYAERLESGKGVEKNLQEAVKYCKNVLAIEPSNYLVKDLLDQCLSEMK